MLNTYPVRSIRLSNGRRLTIRPILPTDAPLIDAMHHRCSEKSLYSRYHQTYKPSLSVVEALCNTNAGTGAAFVAVVENPRESIVALAYYIYEDNRSSAEPAILVEDAYQGLGLGRHLLGALRQQALANGVQQFVAYVLPSNEAIMQLTRRSGLNFHSTFAYGTRELCIDLTAMQPQLPIVPPHLATATLELPRLDLSES